MIKLNDYIIEKLRINKDIKSSNNFDDNRKDLLVALNKYYSTAFKKDMPKIMENLKKWIDEFGPSDFKILVPDWDKDFVSKYLVKWDINKYIEWVNLDKFYNFCNNNIPSGLENAVYNHEYSKRKYISLHLGKEAAYIETYELSILIVSKKTEIK